MIDKIVVFVIRSHPKHISLRMSSYLLDCNVYPMHTYLEVTPLDLLLSNDT